MVLHKIVKEVMRPLRQLRKAAKSLRSQPRNVAAEERQTMPIEPYLRDTFFTKLIERTNNFGEVKWLGQPIWQNVLDLWTIQEVIAEVRPELLIECGTNRGGSALFYAHLMDLMGQGSIVTIDVEKLHDISHPRITFLLGSSIAPSIVQQVQALAAAATGPVLAILDSDHSQAHVAAELEAYAPLVTAGSYCLVQDGVIDVLPALAAARPGPLPAIDAFAARHHEFEVDHQRSERFLITHHPRGWLRRKAKAA